MTLGRYVISGLCSALAAVLLAGTAVAGGNVYQHLPFDPTPSVAGQSPATKLVFAHYFLPYPLAIQNVPSEQGYYERNYLNPHGEKDKFYAQGGLLRQRPLKRAPVPEYESFRLTDLRQEVRLAKAIGIDGFSLNIMSLSGAQWEQTERMLQVAEEEGFRILIMPDMNAGLRSHPDKFVDLIKYLDKFSSVQRLSDGAIAVAPYLAERQSPTWWAEQKKTLADAGVHIALVPVFLDVSGSFAQYKENWPGGVQEILYGLSGWGTRSPTKAASMAPFYQAARAQGLMVMAPVAPQDMRPKSSIFTEANNSLAYRSLWRSAIINDADWVQIITWNDYSESTEVAPSTLTGHAFYDLTAYYIEWFKHGKPSIVRDAMYAFYRGQRWNAPAVGGKFKPFKMKGGYAPRDEIELLAFLEAPATLEIEINGRVRKLSAAAGLQSFTVPLEPGVPEFRLLRNGKVISRLTGRHAIRQRVDIPNLLYRGEAAARVSQDNSFELSWPWRYRDFTADMSLRPAREKSSFPRRTDERAMQYADNSPTKNSGVGYSFRLTKPESGALVIGVDFQLQNTVKSPSDYEIALTTLDDRTLFSLPLKADIKGWCAGGDTLCEFKIEAGKWYRLEWPIRSAGDGEPTLDVFIVDESGARHVLPGRTFERWGEGFFALRAATSGAPGAQGKILLDNVTVFESWENR